jgi:patatin-like phospholipase
MPSPATAPTGPTPVHEVLRTELQALRPEVAVGLGPTLADVYERIGNIDGKAPLSALCLSGGGIRSATFNLGVLQELARLGVLGRFDYLSSVSGGGYIASWLRTWMARDGSAKVIESLRRTPRERNADPLTPEPGPLSHLREYSNYLTPRLGLMSADTWAAAAMIIRNMLLNWLVIVPLLAAALTLPQILLLAFQATTPAPRYTLVWLSLSAAFLAGFGTHVLHRTSGQSRSQARYLWGSVLPIFIACVLLAAAGLGLDVSKLGGGTGGAARLWLFAGLWCVGAPVLGWIAAAFKPAPPGRLPPWWVELLALCGSGAVATTILVGVAYGGQPYLRARLPLYTILTIPLLLGVYLIARVLFVAIGSLAEGRRAQIASPEDAAREWWARLSGWVLISATVWFVLSAVVILGGWGLERFRDTWLPQWLAGIGGVSGLVASLLASSGGTPAGPESTSKTVSLPKRIALAVAAPLFCLCLGIVLAGGTARLGRVITGQPLLLRISSPGHLAEVSETGWWIVALFLMVPTGLVALGFLAGSIVNVNRFSLHGFYRNRLVRAYLGASNPRRNPDPFTGFDPKDNLRMHELWKATETDPSRVATRPLPVVCVALNLTSGEKLAWQQRKAESFSMTPFYCGSFRGGYRRARDYGGQDGVSVGTAVTISGAAANPNMGYHSSPLLAFMMTLFNARLGAWLGNPNEYGNDACNDPGPAQAVVPLVSELFGFADDKSAYVNLSDGGHFDNLGLYEMVLRRCRFILVSDAGQDPACSFEDLGNAVRRVRVDFGVPVEFEQRFRILPRTASGVGAYCAVGKVRYSKVDATPPEKDGDLIYVKPALEAGATPDPCDVYSYKVASKDFPHEATADQWFSEAQFESYRALGSYLISLVAAEEPILDLPALKKRFEEYINGRVAPPPSSAP